MSGVEGWEGRKDVQGITAKKKTSKENAVGLRL
jgi:hypothetical protein